MGTTRYGVGWTDFRGVFQPVSNALTTAPTMTVHPSNGMTIQGDLTVSGAINGRVLHITDLDHAVFKTDISVLVNLWLAKFGRDWVEKDKVTEDEFFEFAMLRLRSTGRLEEHVVWTSKETHPTTNPNQRITVVRIVDGEK